MLTSPLLYMCWTLAFIGVIAGVCLYLTTGLWRWLVFAYYMVGFWFLAIPMKIMLHATSLFGVLYLATIWPIWLSQGLFGFSLASITPLWFIALLFDL